MLERLETERGLFVRGPAWQQGKWLPVRALGSNVLCKGHNSRLSELDARMALLGDQVLQLGEELVRGDPSPWLFAIHGHDIERWLLKVLCGMCAGGHAATQSGDRYERTVPEQWVRILFGREPMPAGWGFHVNLAVGQQMPFGVRELNAAPISAGGKVVGVVADVFGWEFVLAMLSVRPDLAEGALNASSMYRPALLQNPTPAGSKAIYFHWEVGERGR